MTAAGPLDGPYRGIGLGQRITCQPSGKEDVAPVDAERRRGDIKRLEPRGGLVEVAQSRGQVPGRQSDQGTVADRVDCFDHLAGLGEQLGGGNVVSIGTRGYSHRGIHQPTRAQRPGRPDFVPGPAEHRNRVLQVRESGCVPADRPRRDAPPVQDPCLQHTLGQLLGPVERVEPGCGAAGIDKPDPQGGQDVGLALSRAQLTGQPQRRAQLTDSRLDIAVLPQDDPRGLVRDACLAQGGPCREHRAGPGQRHLRAGHRERKQVIDGDPAPLRRPGWLPHESDIKWLLLRRLQLHQEDRPAAPYGGRVLATNGIQGIYGR